MSGNPFKRSQARRAAAKPRAHQDGDLTIKRLIGQGLAAVAVSALGMAVAVSVGMTASAQSSQISTDAPVAGQGNPDISRANPAPQADLAAREQAAIEQATNKANGIDEGGSLDVFNRQGDDPSRNAVRGELDKAVANQQAKERNEQLTQTSDKAALESGAAVRDSRSRDLVIKSEAAKREQLRLEEEKRKAEEALKAQQNQGGSNMPQQAPAQEQQQDAGAGSDTAAANVEGQQGQQASGGQAPQAPEAAPAASGSGGASTPMAKGSYSVGARWGAVGSWSRYHTGQDLPAPVGTPLLAAADGVVVTPNGGGWAGTHVIIRHNDGTATLYAHMSGTTVRPGQTVKGGQVIGAVGMTGRTFGPHLHFEHYPNPSTTSNPYTTDDPAAWLARQGVRL